MSKDENGRFAYSPVSVNFLTEIAKCVFAIGLIVNAARKPGAESKQLKAGREKNLDRVDV